MHLHPRPQPERALGRRRSDLSARGVSRADEPRQSLLRRAALAPQAQQALPIPAARPRECDGWPTGERAGTSDGDGEAAGGDAAAAVGVHARCVTGA
jgi:hypothetical protein